MIFARSITRRGCAVVSVGTLSLLLTSCSPRNDYAPPPPTAVSIAEPIVVDVPQYLIETGRTEAVGRTEIRARVSGVFEKAKRVQDDAPEANEINLSGDSEFIEAGDYVKEGQLLFLIEKDEYAAAVNSALASQKAATAEHLAAQAKVAVATADIADAQAQLTSAQNDFRRQEDLARQNATSQQDYDRAKAALDSANATLTGSTAAEETAKADVARAVAKIDQAAAELEQAELDLKYTEVKALISGRITELNVKEKNYVQANTVLTTIINDDQVRAFFDFSDALILSSEGRGEEFKKAGPDSPIRQVRLQRPGDKGYPFVGVIDSFDAEGFDANSGTLRIRATFDNSDGRLIPGMFVRIRYEVGVYRDALMVPERAIGRDQIGDFVYVIEDGDTVRQVQVTLGPKIDEWITILEGLTEDAVVVTSGVQRVRDGSKVAGEEDDDLPELPKIELTESNAQSEADDADSQDQ